MSGILIPDSDEYLRALAEMVVEALDDEIAEKLPGRVNDPWFLDAHSGWSEWLHQDLSDPDRFAIEYRADIEPTLDANMVRQNDGTNGYGSSREWHEVASIPPILGKVIEQEMGADPFAKGNEELLERVLNDSDYSRLRTSSGRVKVR